MTHWRFDLKRLTDWLENQATRQRVCAAWNSLQNSRSSVMGRSGTRLPVAWHTALAIAPATPRSPSAPVPLFRAAQESCAAARTAAPDCC
jgi:hypothetical protein